MKLTGRLFLFGIIPFLALALFGPHLFEFAFGKAWRQAGLYASAISISAFARPIVTPVSRLFMVFEKQATDFILNGIRSLLIVILFLISSALKLSAFIAIFVYSVEMLVVYLLTFVMIRRLVNRVVTHS